MQLSTMLTGGDPRSLGKTEQVVDMVLAKRSLLAELLACLDDTDVIVRMRASDALEKVCRVHPDWFTPFKEQLLTNVPLIRQPSVQWHLAQMLSEMQLSPTESKRAVTILKRNLATMDDWIVTNLTLESLATFVRGKAFDKNEFIRLLNRSLGSRHKSVVTRANKLLREFSSSS